MANVKVRFTFKPDLIKDPLIWSLGREFEITTNIRRANVVVDQGCVILDLMVINKRSIEGLHGLKKKVFA